MSMKGTPLFMAPEMLLKRKCGRRVDVWSLGCAVLEMVTTRPPWADAFKHPVEIIAHFNENPGPPPLPEDLPRGLRHFLLSCFSWDPEVRPSAQELIGHPYLQARLAPLDGDAGCPSGDDVPLEEMDRVSAVTRMRRCSSATLDLLAVQARQAALGVSIGALAAFGTAPSGTFRPPSPRYGPGSLAHNKRTPTRRRMYGSVGVAEMGPPPPETVAPTVAPVVAKAGRGQSNSSSGSASSGGNTTAPDDDVSVVRRNSSPATGSPQLSPEKLREHDKLRAAESRRPGRGAGCGYFEEEGRISGPIVPPRPRGHVMGCDRGGSAGGNNASTRSNSSTDGAHADSTAAAACSCPCSASVGAAAAGDASTNGRKIPTPLSPPPEDELLGVTLVGGSGVDPGYANDTPPPMVRPLEHRSSSCDSGEPSWPSVAQGPAATALLQRGGASSKGLWGTTGVASDPRGGGMGSHRLKHKT